LNIWLAVYARRRECDIAVVLSGRYRPSEWSATAVGAQRGYGWHHQARQIAKKAELARIERRLEAAQERRDDATTRQHPLPAEKSQRGQPIQRVLSPDGPHPAPISAIGAGTVKRHRQQLGLSVGQPLSNAPTLGTSG
jgi:hypothetical protein